MGRWVGGIAVSVAPHARSIHPSMCAVALEQVRVSYIPKERLRRRYWPKYAWGFGWFVHGKIGESTFPLLAPFSFLHSYIIFRGLVERVETGVR